MDNNSLLAFDDAEPKQKTVFSDEEVKKALDAFGMDKETEEHLRKYNVIPIAFHPEKNEIVFAANQLYDSEIAAWAQFHCKKMVTFQTVETETLTSLLQQHFSTFETQEDVDISQTDNVTAISDYETVRMQRAIITESIARNASDIHIEVTSNSAAVRIRINGLLRPLFNISRSMALSVIRVFLNEAHMKIEDLYAPQSGRLRKRVGKEVYDLRLQSIGTYPNNPYLVIRLLKASGSEVTKSLPALGFNEKQVASLEHMVTKEGIVIFTGPTGSGKTTTLYSLLAGMDLTGKNVISIEDPPEIMNSNVRQIGIQEQRNITWEESLKSILRMDPDIIVIGEIRDGLAAETAMQAAMTGHLVLTSIHTRGIEDIPQRFLQLAGDYSSVVNPTTVAHALIGLVSQRLVGKIWKPVAIPGAIPPSIRKRFEEKGIPIVESEEESKVPYAIVEPVLFPNVKASGTDYFAGYDMTQNGRTVIGEVVYSDEEFSEILKQSPEEIRAYLNNKEGHYTMIQHAASKIRTGDISIKDVLPYL
jgi:type IV pilus assembly protein PilB